MKTIEEIKAMLLRTCPAPPDSLAVALMDIESLKARTGAGAEVRAALETLDEIACLLDDYADRLDEAKGYMDPSEHGDEEREAIEERIGNVARILGCNPQPKDERKTIIVSPPGADPATVAHIMEHVRLTDDGPPIAMRRDPWGKEIMKEVPPCP